MKKKTYCLNLKQPFIIILPLLLLCASCWDGLNDMLDKPADKQLPPVTLTASTLSNNSLTINWQELEVTYDHFLVTWTPGGTSGTETARGTTTCTISGLSSSTEYTITVQAIGQAGHVVAESIFRATTTASGTNSLMFIFTAAELAAVKTNDSNYYYVVMADIDLIGYASWTPIGTGGSPFKGIFDGNGHGISKLKIYSTIQYIGLFGYTNGAKIKNCNVSGSIISTTNNLSIGGLVGWHEGAIENCSSSITIIANEIGASGLITGGLVGMSGYSTAATITNSHSSGSITVNSGSSDCCTGGLIGQKAIGTINNCYSTVSVTSTSGNTPRIGGLVGFHSSGSITNCFATGTVSGTGGNHMSGGLVGANQGIISNCYATGPAKGTYGTGGLVGYNTSGSNQITHCYATGIVTGSGSMGGLIGYHNSGTYTSCYYDKETTGQSDVGKGDGKSTAEMKSQATYTGWDFSSTWGISSGINSGYPYLQALKP